MAQVTLKDSRRQFAVEQGEPILDAGLRAGIKLAYGCRNGTCGSCRATLLQGQVSYPTGRPPALHAEEESCGHVLLCQARAQGDLVIRARELPLGVSLPKRLPVRIAAVRRWAVDVMGLYLSLPKNMTVHFLAGQYMDIILEDGSRRSFSMANAPWEEGAWEFHVRHLPGGRFTESLFQGAIPEKTVLRIEAPLGGFHLHRESPRPWLFVAGGTGYAPIKAMLSQGFHEGEQRPMTLFWGTRNSDGLYMGEINQLWAEEHENFAYVPVLSEAEPSWSGERGWVHEAVLRHHPDLAGFDVYMSGPPLMVEAAMAAFARHGLPDEQLFFDSFDLAAAPPVSP